MRTLLFLLLALCMAALAWMTHSLGQWWWWMWALAAVIQSFNAFLEFVYRRG